MFACQNSDVRPTPGRFSKCRPFATTVRSLVYVCLGGRVMLLNHFKVNAKRLQISCRD